MIIIVFLDTGKTDLSFQKNAEDDGKSKADDYDIAVRSLAFEMKGQVNKKIYKS